MGDILFKAGKQVRLNTKDLSWIARDSDLTFGAARGSSTQNAPEGVDLLIGEVPEATNRTGQAQVLNAYIGRLKDGKYVRTKWGGIGEQLFLVIKTSGLEGKSVSANIIDRDGLLQGAAMQPLTVMPDDEKELVKINGYVRSDGFAILPFIIKSKDPEKTRLWRQKIGDAEGKKVPVCVLIDAHRPNPDLTIKYYGQNPEGDTGPTVGKSNYWLDTEGTWFELRRKNPVIVLDPGHGDNNSRNSVFDPGAVDGTEYEKDYALILAKAVQASLNQDNRIVYMTREDDINVDPKKPLNWRFEIANEKEGDIFISFHLDSGTKEEAFSVYQQDKGNESSSIRLAELIMENLASVVPVPTNAVRQVKGYTRYTTLAVLNNFKGEAGVLMEFGGIASLGNRTRIKSESAAIAQAFTNAIKVFSDENF